MKLADGHGQAWVRNPMTDPRPQYLDGRATLAVVAFDISLGELPQSAEPAPADFEEFYTQKASVVVDALTLACGPSTVSTPAIAAALTRSSQRWKHLDGHHNPVGWAIHAGLEYAEKALRDTGPITMNQATGGYVRGLSLDQAFASLPLQQRAALVAGYFLDWSDDWTAAGFEIPATTARTRRERGLAFIGHHLRLGEAEVVPLLRSYLQELTDNDQSVPPDMSMVRRRGQRRTIRNRVAGALAAAALIVVGGALFQADGGAPVAAGPELVDGPSTSAQWFGPVSDGRGAFVALNTSGASRFVGSNDGSEWIELTTWNSRAIDIRASVSSFDRTGGRYVAVIETPSRFDVWVPPFVATSSDLRDWTVRQVDVEQPLEVDGLRSRYDVVASAATGTHVLVALEGSDELDYRSFGITAGDVCIESAAPSLREYFLCNGETITVATTPEDDRLIGARYFRAAGSGAFVEVELPAEAVARSLVGFAGGFAVADASLGHVWVSPDGEQWQRATSSVSANRFLLLEGGGGSGAGAGALVVEPDALGWRSQVVLTSGLGVAGTIPLQVEPAGVWSQPDVASGPAGWALFVTTSRPWERADTVPGWAVVSNEWIVSQLPDAETISAQLPRTDTTLRFAVDGDGVQIDDDGTIVLLDPLTNAVLVEITQQDIDQSRPEALDQSSIKAQVFFSADGVEWRSVWSSTSDTWSGSIAVGDSELLLSGTQLTGGPITISLDG